MQGRCFVPSRKCCQLPVIRLPKSMQHNHREKAECLDSEDEESCSIPRPSTCQSLELAGPWCSNQHADKGLQPMTRSHSRLNHRWVLPPMEPVGALYSDSAKPAGRRISE